MHVRNPQPPEPGGDRRGHPARNEPGHGSISEPHVDSGDAQARPAADGSVTFRVPAGLIGAKFGVAAAVAAVALIRGIGPEFVIGMVAAIAVAVYAVRDLRNRDRLCADQDGLRIGVGRRRLAWSEVGDLRVDTRTRFGVRAELLEIDAGEDLYLFSRFDLGATPSDAVAVLEAVRAG